MAKDGIVLLNMGGPNNLDEVELFLKNMFRDKNILTMKSDLLRKFVAFMIVFRRVEASKEIYRQLGGKSPMVEHTKKLINKLHGKINNDDLIVDFAMRYTPPFASDVIKRLNENDVKNIYLIPLYPQYSTTTTKSSLEDFKKAYMQLGGSGKIFETQRFFSNNLYNLAILERIKEEMKDGKYEDFDIIFSAHGLPKKIVEAGDSYEKEIEEHVEILKDMMLENGINFKNIHLAYQSKVGRLEWLKPSLEDKLQEIENKKVLIFAISFTIDNSETDYELSIEYKEVAQELGFEDYRVARSLNDSDLFVDALADIYSKMRQ